MIKEDKIVSVQYLRGLAALGVVFCHYGSSLKSYPKLSSFFNFGQAGVYVFFLISGFIIVYSLTKSDYKPPQFFRFLLKRSIRIDPSYYIIIILTILLFKILSFIPTFRGQSIPLIPGQIVAHLFYLVPFTKYPFYNHVFWTLCVEFQFYLLIGILYFISNNSLYKTISLVLFSLMCLIPFSNSYYIVFNYAPMFAMGISIINLYKEKTWSKSLLPIFISVIVIYKFDLTIFLLLIGSVSVILYFKLIIKQLSFLGDVSYSLYLTHSLVLIVFLGVLKKFNIDTNQNQLIWLFLEVLSAIIFSYIFYILIERPSLRLSKHIFYKRKKRD